MKEEDKNSEEYLNRNKDYRVAALHEAVIRAGQDGGLSGEAVDVYVLANLNYNWLQGDNTVTEAPIKEELMKKKEK